jgi:hypothetical protein
VFGKINTAVLIAEGGESAGNCQPHVVGNRKFCGGSLVAGERAQGEVDVHGGGTEVAFVDTTFLDVNLQVLGVCAH